MADSIVTSFATDDVGGVHYPRVKLTQGADGEASDVSQASPLHANAAMRTDVIFAGSVSCLPVHVLLSASSSSTVTIVAAQTSARMRVLSYVLVTNATGSVTFGSSTTALTGVMIFDPRGGLVVPFNPLGHFQTATGQPLTVTTGDCRVAGHITYVPVSVT
jgi:hypothetical protein